MRNPRFTADSLSDYMDRKRESGERTLARVSQEGYEEARDRYRDALDAVRSHLPISGE